MQNIIVSSLLICFLSSCATITNGKYQQVSLTSDPQGANVWVNNKFIGMTPTYVCLKRSEPYIVKFELEGYKPYQAQLCPSVSGWFFGNILFGGVIGIAVDAATGSMYKLSPNELNACLQAEDSRVIIQGDDCKVVVLSKVDPSWEKIDTLERV